MTRTPILACAFLAACGSGDAASTTQPDARPTTPDAPPQPDAPWPCRLPDNPAGPQWTAGRYFPSFPPTTTTMYEVAVATPLDDQATTWQKSWRMSDSTDAMNALTLVGMQGVINRDTPCVYLDWAQPRVEAASYWAGPLGQHVTLQPVGKEGAAAVGFLYQHFSDRFKGAVIYDPDVPDTINVATMLAGLEDRLILAPGQLGMPGIPTLTDVTDLRTLVTSQHWDTTVAGRVKLYTWVHDNLWSRLDKRIFGIASPGPPTSDPILGIQPTTYYPIGLAARDYLVALRAPVVWLEAIDPTQKALFDELLGDAPTPIPVSGGYDEFTDVALASHHGDWQMAINWPNAPLSGGNLTALAGVPQTLKPYQPALDADRILATLGTHPVTTIFFSDGDNLGYQIDRGFGAAYDFDDVRGHRAAWTVNPALVDLAPLVWNDYIDVANGATFVAGLAGAGYLYPQLMTPTQLDAYLTRSADYFKRTGLRVTHIFTGYFEGAFQDYPPVAKAYYDKLKGSGYLGTFVGVGTPFWGLPFVYAGVPTPGVTPFSYTSTATILADLPGRTLSDFTIRTADWPGNRGNLGEIVDGGTAVKYAASLANSLIYRTDRQVLLAGNYTVRYTVKVASTASSAEIGRFKVLGESENIVLTDELVLHPSDFTAANQLQTFTIPFTLPAARSDVVFFTTFTGGLTDLTVATIHVTRDAPAPMPAVVPVFSAFVDNRTELAGLAEQLTSAGVIVLTPDELMAAFNPEYMIGFAATRIGANAPALVTARAQLQAGQYLDALLTVRAALAP